MTRAEVERVYSLSIILDLSHPQGFSAACRTCEMNSGDRQMTFRCGMSGYDVPLGAKNLCARSHPDSDQGTQSLAPVSPWAGGAEHLLDLSGGHIIPCTSQINPHVASIRRYDGLSRGHVLGGVHFRHGLNPWQLGATCAASSRFLRVAEKSISNQSVAQPEACGTAGRMASVIG